MSRFYHALNDPRTCTRCNSVCALFGQIDEETSWFGWCTLCNDTWHNRRAEGILFSVNRDSARRSLAALTGNDTTASTALTFLQTNIDCVKHNKQLRHHLNIQVLTWLCCPLAWFYESDSEAEEERIQHPVLRTLQETFIRSKTFKTMCFPCPIFDISWTLLHAVCAYINGPLTTHVCDNIPRREHAWHLFRWAHNPWIWNEITKEWFYVSNPPAEWHCYFFHNKQGQQIHWWLSGKRWFLEPVSPKWSLFLRTGSDPGEGDWQRFLSDKGPWMRNQATDEFFLAKNGFSQSITSKNGLSQWQQDICFDQQGRLIHYWFFENRWFLEPQPSRGNWVPPPGGELLRATQKCSLSDLPFRTIAWGTTTDVVVGRDKRTREEETQWQAFDSTDGKGTWWWNKNDEDWFLESEPGNWTQFIDSNSGQPHWCHPDGRSFCASLDLWLIEQCSDDEGQASPCEQPT